MPTTTDGGHGYAEVAQAWIGTENASTPPITVEVVTSAAMINSE